MIKFSALVSVLIGLMLGQLFRYIVGWDTAAETYEAIAAYGTVSFAFLLITALSLFRGKNVIGDY